MIPVGVAKSTPPEGSELGFLELEMCHIMDDVVKVVLEHHMGEIVLLIYVHGCMLLLVHRLCLFGHWR